MVNANFTRARDARADRHFATGEPSIITRDYIQDELKLADDQKQKLQNTSSVGAGNPV